MSDSLEPLESLGLLAFESLESLEPLGSLEPLALEALRSFGVAAVVGVLVCVGAISPFK